MVFSSLVFLFLFLPVFLAAYFLTPVRHRNVTLAITSVLFYAWWRVDFALLLIVVMLFTYGIGKMISASPHHPKYWLWTGIAGNLALLGYFKYADFGIHSLNVMLTSLGLEPWPLLHLILPIGISFYVFHCLSYLVDVYRKDALPAASFWEFSAFTAMMPHLIAGPVLKFKDMAGQMKHPVPNWDNFNTGSHRFMKGFAKKILIADSIAPLADTLFALPDPSMGEAWLGALAYGMQLYFDFSGYSDMAIGLALMIGFRFQENFNAPYTAHSVSDFWRRWHISLSTWLRDYVYIPLGGSHAGVTRTCLNLFLVMSLCGLWHGASINFLIWGMAHGLVMVGERLNPLKLHHSLSTFLTFLFVMSTWIVFRAENLPQALNIYEGLIGQHGFGFGEALYWQIRWLSFAMLCAAFYLAVIHPRLSPPKETGLILVITLFTLALLKLIAQNYTPFLYFQF